MVRAPSRRDSRTRRRTASEAPIALWEESYPG